MSTVVLGFVNSAIVCRITNKTVAENANYAVAYRVANNTLAYSAANNAVAYGVVNSAVAYAGTSFNVLMHMCFNDSEAAAARNASQVYHGRQLPSDISLKNIMDRGK